MVVATGDIHILLMCLRAAFESTEHTNAYSERFENFTCDRIDAGLEPPGVNPDTNHVKYLYLITYKQYVVAAALRHTYFTNQNDLPHIFS